MAIDFQRVWNWYSRESVQKALLETGKNREVVSVYKEGNYGKRPNVIQYQGDIVQAVAEGAVAFHGSVERWNSPMKLGVGMAKQELDALRHGWDILLDPDVPDFEIAKIVVRQILEALKDHGVKNYSLKFSGGKSFHIGIPFESFPEKINLQQSSLLYPEVMHRIIEFIKWYVKNQLRESLLALDSIEDIAKRIGKPQKEITGEDGLDPFKVVSFDLFSSRHLFRLPYSLHEKSLLVSLPLKDSQLDGFEKDNALPEKVKVDELFLKQKFFERDAEVLLIEAMDWSAKHAVEMKVVVQEPRQNIAKKRFIPEEYFPPCIKKILQGMSDGRKRSVFILINFLTNMGWTTEQIEKRVFEWNEKNYPPLQANYLRSQLRWHFQQKGRTLLPPNCSNENFYKALGLYDTCCQEVDHTKIKNPVNYPFQKLKRSDKLPMKKRR